MLLSSHILAEVEALCDRVSIIRDGRAVGPLPLAALTLLACALAGPGSQASAGALSADRQEARRCEQPPSPSR